MDRNQKTAGLFPIVTLVVPEVRAIFSCVRASTQSLYGIVANDPAEAIYYIYSDADGGLSFMLSHEPPEDEKLVSNWLPAPEGRFYVLLRTYLPNQEMIEQKWAPAPMVPESKPSPDIQPSEGGTCESMGGISCVCPDGSAACTNGRQDECHCSSGIIPWKGGQDEVRMK
ncbi:MAG: DUF1214 domain-containing protein [Polyangiaceae bacterium]|nr:DUF1214 domain-containing protein [Polyangiaceae bacterium]